MVHDDSHVDWGLLFQRNILSSFSSSASSTL